MKVLVVNSLFYPDEPGGAERVVRTLAVGMAARGVETVVACLSATGRRQDEVIDGVRVIRLPLANLFWPFGRSPPPPAWRRLAWHALDDWNPLMGRRLARVIAAERPDVVDLHNLAGFSSAAIGAARRCGVPVAQTLHDYYFACPRTTMFRDGADCARPCGQCRALTRRRRHASDRVDLAAGVSAAVLATLRAAGAFRHAARCETLWNPATRPAPPPADPPAPDGTLRLGFLGRLDVTKGLETFIDALRLLDGQAVSAAIAGRGPAAYEAALRQRAAGLDVTFLGHVDPAALFGRIDVLVVPSHWREPFGLVVQEALAHGVPVIGADAGGIPEVIGGAGAGLVVPPRDPAALAAAVRRLLASGFDRRGWGDICRAQAARFAPAAIIDRRLALFGELRASAQAAQLRHGGG